MREGEVASPSPTEKITCIRSGKDGGPFIFELELAPGSGGPPTHTHDEGDETIEILEGEMGWKIHGKTRVMKKGDTLTLTPNDPHTFWNASKTEVLRARVTHGARFERLIAQPNLTAMLMYLVYVDPGASRSSSMAMSAAMRVMAWFGKLRGIKPVVEPVDA